MTAASPAPDLAAAALALCRDFADARSFLDLAPPLAATRPPPPRQLPVCAELVAALRFTTPATHALTQALAAAAPALEWRQTYGAADFGAEFLQRYGWTELIGLRGPIASESLAVGFLLLGAGVEYPAHAHEAEEFYLPLAGAALWRRGEGGFALREPGEPIFHRAWEAHAMRTQAAPLLALSLWRGGDLAAKSRIVS